MEQVRRCKASKCVEGTHERLGLSDDSSRYAHKLEHPDPLNGLGVTINNI